MQAWGEVGRIAMVAAAKGRRHGKPTTDPLLECPQVGRAFLADRLAPDGRAWSPPLVADWSE